MDMLHCTVISNHIQATTDRRFFRSPEAKLGRACISVSWQLPGSSSSTRWNKKTYFSPGACLSPCAIDTFLAPGVWDVLLPISKRGDILNPKVHVFWVPKNLQLAQTAHEMKVWDILDL